MHSNKVVNDVYLYCMFCGKDFFVRDMFKFNGHYDVCKDPECIQAYKDTIKNKNKRARKQYRRLDRGENYIDPTWMNGECYE